MWLNNIWIFKAHKIILKYWCSRIESMKKTKSKKIKNKSNKKIQDIGQTKNSAKLVLFVFGIGPIIGITIFLYSNGFFNSPNM